MNIRLDKTANTFLILFSVLAMLLTGVLVERIVMRNNLSSIYRCRIGLNGSRLSDEFYANVKKVSSVRTANTYATQYEFVINNLGTNDLENWNIFLAMPRGSSVTDVWNVELARDDREDLVITPVNYNMTISAGGSVSFGFTIHTRRAYMPSALMLRGFKTVPPGATTASRLIIVLLIIWGAVFVGFMVARLNSRSYREKQKTDIKIILQSMNTFISFIDAKDPYTRGHSRRVAMYAAEIAKRMHLPENEIQNVYYAGLLHDAGKISIPDAVLNKPGKLTDEEMAAIRNHTVAGGNMLKQLSIPGVRETALYHHERYDGLGYPEGLRGNEIPLYARIVGVADSYDAMSSNRVYRRHLNKDEIIEEIQKGSGNQFDPTIVVYMVDMINDGYVNVVKMETADSEDGSDRLHLREEDIPGLYMGF
ncbi:HD domain-containing protein [Butyrivibrio sp. XB500-5]|uniref:HD domain-containing phosphohydrolase n=1 Tax=Butyrivibrio sp. XB500-5 TaxID=2364880 RepID=UPI000EA839F6|nr:HD domain-containing phosphohydrolase [Butyrivibrio sp. XB500-5]RKM58534.1 HD domain-containing protein [Butyrivibrio sp. XB500-5]